MKKTVVIVKHLLAVLKFPKSVPNFIVYSKAIYNAMHAAAIFASSAAKLAALTAAIDTLDAAQSGTKTKPQTHTIAQRNVALDAVKDALRLLQADVQAAADADKENAQVIIETAGMNVKKSSGREKQKNGAKNGPQSGQVDLTAEVPGPHEWRMSTDNATWTILPATRIAKTRVSALPVGVLYYFQNRPMLTNGELSEWTESVSIRVI